MTDKQQINASTLLQDTKRSEALGISYCATVKRQTSNSYLPHCSALQHSNPRNPFKTIKHQTMLVTMLFTKYGKKRFYRVCWQGKKCNPWAEWKILWYDRCQDFNKVHHREFKNHIKQNIILSWGDQKTDLKINALNLCNFVQAFWLLNKNINSANTLFFFLLLKMQNLIQILLKYMAVFYIYLLDFE